MSYQPSLDDTQPRQFVTDQNARTRTVTMDEPPERSGCGVPVILIAALLLLALLIVVLSGVAGWTQGSRQANVNATATQNAVISEQLNRIPMDIADGNLVLLDVRIQFIATMTPGVPGIEGLIQTATALYLNSLPTATPTPSPTPEITAAPLDSFPTQPPLGLTPQTAGGFDLAALLAQAQQAISVSQWQTAIELLDVILAADSSYEAPLVRRLMSQALNSYARQLYETNQPAAANIIVGRAEEFGPLAEGISYERYAAELYLNARAAVGMGSPQATRALQTLIDLGPGRYYQEAVRMLRDQYIALGDAYAAQGNQCLAATQYQNAVNVSADNVAVNKRNTAQTLCSLATPTVDPNWFQTPGAVPPDFAPIGVPDAPPG